MQYVAINCNEDERMVAAMKLVGFVFVDYDGVWALFELRNTAPEFAALSCDDIYIIFEFLANFTAKELGLVIYEIKRTEIAKLDVTTKLVVVCEQPESIVSMLGKRGFVSSYRDGRRVEFDIAASRKSPQLSVFKNLDDETLYHGFERCARQTGLRVQDCYLE